VAKTQMTINDLLKGYLKLSKHNDPTSNFERGIVANIIVRRLLIHRRNFRGVIGGLGEAYAEGRENQIEQAESDLEMEAVRIMRDIAGDWEQ